MSNDFHSIHPIFFSTNNVIRTEDDQDDSFYVFITEINGKNRNTSFKVFPFWDIEMMKRLLIKRLNISSSTNISEISVFYKGCDLPNHRSLSFFIEEESNSIVNFKWRFKEEKNNIGIRQSDLKVPPYMRDMISDINLGIKRGIKPKLTLDGTGGTYIFSNANGKKVALFKPMDEEAFSPNNPRNYEGKLGQIAFRHGVLSGEGYKREITAYLIDAHYGGIANVPQTVLVEVCHPSLSYKSSFESDKIVTRQHNVSEDFFTRSSKLNNGISFYWKQGSLQEYVNAKDTCGDFNPLVFSISDVHCIGILDIQLLNLDRNDGNILVTIDNSIDEHLNSHENRVTPEGNPSKYRLIPIDHGLILPDTMRLEEIDLVWFYWPQSKIPFSKFELNHIFQIDPDTDAVKLQKKLNIREDCLRTMRVSTRVLKIGAQMHLNLYQIVSLIVRVSDVDLPSIMEEAVKTALIQACTAISASSYFYKNRLPGDILDLSLPKFRSNFPPTNDVISKNALSSCKDLEIKKSFNSSKSLLTKNRESQGKNFVESFDFPKPILLSESPCIYTSKLLSTERNNNLETHDYLQSEIISESNSDILTSSPDSSPLIIHLNKSHRDKIGVLEKNNFDFKKKPNNILNNLSNGACHSINMYSRPYSAINKSSKNHRKLDSNNKSTWSLLDSYEKLVYLDWQNRLFESTFFECFESLIKHFIANKHPHWLSYPYNGK